MTDICTCGDSPRPAHEALGQDSHDLEIKAKSLQAKAKAARSKAKAASEELRERLARLPDSIRKATVKKLERDAAKRPKPPPRLSVIFSCRACPDEFSARRDLDTHLVVFGLEKRHRCGVHGRAVPNQHCPLGQERLRPPVGYVHSHFLREHRVDVPLSTCATYLSAPGERTIKKDRDSREVQGGRPESNRRKF